ncbi:kinase suppressor of Ras 1 [Eupeodes corollae]|uniref:kinase suppressor of Ras 1 n=1 Tax=Eupeodes corollae TaxID=290404 RepID=UPI0024914639|nr:kinase suppressor of Ras 1 [Eupeodes corollae]
MDNNTTTNVNNGLDVIQGMIDISADRLEGLRTQCATSATLTQQEIRILETKLVRMFSELLITKSRLPERIPSSGLAASSSELKQWLRVVGLSGESLNVCVQRINTLEDLLQRSDDELREILVYNPNFRDEEIRRLINAMECLRRCRAALSDNLKEPENLFWDSWDRHHHHHHHHHHRGSTGNIGVMASPRTYRTMNKQKAVQSPVNNNYDIQSPPSTMNRHNADETSSAHGSVITLTPSPSPPNSPSQHTSGSTGAGNGTPGRSGQRKSTPPPKKKHQTLLTYHHPSTPSHNGIGTNSMTASTSSSSSQDPLAIPIAKSKSHESQFQEGATGGLVTPGSSGTNGNSGTGTSSNSNNSSTMPQAIPRTRLHTDPSPESHSSSMSSDIFMENTNNLTVPRSPCTPIVSLGMGHMIAHRFTKFFKVISTCDLCQKQMFFGLKCKECKYRCHKDCEPNVPPSCGLPREFVDEFKKTLKSNEGFFPPSNISPNLSGRSGTTVSGYLSGRRQKVSISASGHHHPDSSSPGSSCNSSSPSSPALFNHQQQHISGTNSGGGSSTASGSTSTGANPNSTPSSLHKNTSQFNFPDVTITNHQTNQTLYLPTSNVGGQSNAATANNNTEHLDNKSSHHNSQSSIANSNNASSMSSILITSGHFSESRIHSETSSGRTASTTGSVLSQINPELADTHKSNDSDKTVSLSGSTSASTDSDRTPVRLDSTEEGDSGNWPRQNSLSLKEWDIPYDDLRLLEKIGKGRFGTVHRALWHGDVAVKLLKEDYLDDEHMLEAFKLEVANFKKTRHENLVLFMGACMNPPYLAIVTSLCKGNTLYTYIHLRRDKFTINRTTLVAQQISQGMGYLHARGIFHKDLRTKNIFLENGKVIITDFGLFSSTKLVYCDIGLGVPSGWLCYLAPELMRALTPYKPTDEILPFSKASDVYSFGTVWYELLCGEFPFKMQPPQSIIWQVGRGMKQTLANLQTSRDVKDILMLCWSFQADDRPDFPKLLTLLERLPKKRLARSPSHPVQLSRSAESVF